MSDLVQSIPEPHPTARLRETLTRLPSYLRLVRALLGDKRLGRLSKAGLGAGLAYLLSPIDLVPGIVPVLGQLDDLAAVLLAIRFALRGLPGPAADALLANAGLSREVISRDLDNVLATAAWVARGAARGGVRVAEAGARAATKAVRLGAETGRSLSSSVRRRIRGSDAPDRDPPA